MGEWKKVLVSGSDIEVRQITASGLSEASKSHIVLYDTGSGALHYTSSDAIGGVSVQYQTGSGTLVDLSQLKIIDYDNNVFVTSDGGQLILQFGNPALPTLGTLSLSGFNTNRFTGPGTGTYVIDSNYSFSLTYTLDPTNTFISGALVADVNGTPTEIVKDSTNDGTLNFNINGSPYETYFSSGSHSFKVRLYTTLEDGSDTYVESGTVNGTLNKANPVSPTINSTWDVWPSAIYATNSGSTSTLTSNIELGVTGSINWYASSITPSNGWTRSSLTPTQASPSTRTISATDSPDSLSATINWTSNGLGDPTSTTTNATKEFDRIISLRYGAFPAGTFTSDLAPTEAELLDLLSWTDNGGIIDFNNTNPNGDTFTISWSGDKYIYIVMSNSYTLNQINVAGFGSIDAFTTGTTTNYRFYVTTDIQAGGAGSSADYVLST